MAVVVMSRDHQQDTIQGDNRGVYGFKKHGPWARCKNEEIPKVGLPHAKTYTPVRGTFANIRGEYFDFSTSKTNHSRGHITGVLRYGLASLAVAHCATLFVCKIEELTWAEASSFLAEVSKTLTRV